MFNNNCLYIMNKNREKKYSQTSSNNIKVGFYFDNKTISQIDFRNVLQGNPGIGGSEYSVVLISYLLAIRENNIEVSLFCTSIGTFPQNLDICVIENLKSCIDKADVEKYDYLVVDSKKFSLNLLKSMGERKIKILLWANNFMSKHELDAYAKSENIKKIINVGREQFELWLDHPIFDKSCYIYNTMTFPKLNDTLLPLSKRKHIVVYIGSLIKAKGFGALAKAWPKVLKKVPDAQLYVIGSGKLYDKNAELGKFGIADANFENEFMPYLQDSNLKLLPSVHFLGVLGQEKFDVLAKSKVGIPNPTGQTETFGYSAVEMQYMGCAIATMKCPGFLDTVISNGNNILYSNVNNLHKYIIKLLLLKEDLDIWKTRKYIEKKYSADCIIGQWEQLITTNNIYKGNYRNLLFRLKWLKIINKKLYKFLRLDPFVSFERCQEYIDKIKRYVRR